MLRVRLAVLIALLVAALAPAASQAAPAWLHDSAVAEQSTGYLACAGTQGGPLEQVLPSIDYAEVYLDQAALPPLGGVQYVRVQWYATGGDYCRQQGGTGAAIEVILPPGAELALSPEFPAFCGFDTIADAAPCPVSAVPGDYGGTLLADGRSGRPTLWPVSDGLNKTRIHVPIRFRSLLQSYATSAERRCDAGPCPADQSGGRVQFAVRFVPGTGATPSAPLVTTVGVSGGVAPAGDAPPSSGPPGTGAPGPGRPSPAAPTARSPRQQPLLAGRVPRTVRRAMLRRGWSVRIRAPAEAIARARLRVGARTVAVTSRRARRAGTVVLKLTAGARALRRIGTRARTAHLEVTVLPRGQARRQQSVRLRLTG